MMEKSDEIWQIKYFRKFDEKNFDKLSQVFVCSSKNKLLWNYHINSLGRDGWEMAGSLWLAL